MAGEEQTDSAGKYAMSGHHGGESTSPKWWPVSFKVFELVSQRCTTILECMTFGLWSYHPFRWAANRVRLHRTGRRSGQQSSDGDLHESANRRTGVRDVRLDGDSDRHLCAGQSGSRHVSDSRQCDGVITSGNFAVTHSHSEPVGRGRQRRLWTFWALCCLSPQRPLCWPIGPTSRSATIGHRIHRGRLFFVCRAHSNKSKLKHVFVWIPSRCELLLNPNVNKDMTYVE